MQMIHVSMDLAMMFDNSLKIYLLGHCPVWNCAYSCVDLQVTLLVGFYVVFLNQNSSTYLRILWCLLHKYLIRYLSVMQKIKEVNVFFFCHYPLRCNMDQQLCMSHMSHGRQRSWTSYFSYERYLKDTMRRRKLQTGQL